MTRSPDITLGYIIQHEEAAIPHQKPDQAVSEPGNFRLGAVKREAARRSPMPITTVDLSLAR
jgi:hypothetical protein